MLLNTKGDPIMKELNLYRLAGRLFMEQQKAILHGISREKPIVLFLVCLLASIIFTFLYSQRKTISFCENIDNAQKIEKTGGDFGLPPDEICNIVHELIPIIKEIAGEKFNSPPKLQFATNNKIEAVLTQELLLQFENLMKDKKKKSNG